MHTVSHFVEHRSRMVKADQRWRALNRLGNVHHIDDHRLLMQQLGLLDKAIHPSATAFVRSLEVIGIEQANLLAVRTDHIENANIGVIDWQVLSLFEANTKQAIHRIENAIL